jgi:glycosyltransferase involved in cell wall biosynthesis/Tfp pilus assembly protein PilF
MTSASECARTERPDALLQKAEELFARGDLPGARELLVACAEDPSATAEQRAQAFNDLAVVANVSGEPREAERLLLEALSSDPAYVPALENLGDLCAAAGDLVQATHWFRRLTDVAPEDPAGWERLAGALRERQRRAESASVVQQARALGHGMDLPSEPAAQAPTPTRADIRRVLIVVDRFFPSVGGTERLAEAVGVSLQAEGITVGIATRPFAERVADEHHGMQIHEIDGDLVASDLVATLYAIALDGRYDAVLAFANATVWPIIASLQLPHPRPRVIVVPCVNAEDSAGLRARPDLLRAYGELVSGADAIGYSSRSAYDIRLCEDLGLPGVYVPNAVERLPAPPAVPAPTASIPGDSPLLVMVANLWPVKNHVGLLDALRSHPGDWRLAMIGAPEFPDHAAQVAMRAAQDPRVHLLGPAAPEGVAAAIEDAQVLLLPSLAEATPLVLLEAMSRQIPWIATPTCGAAHDYAGGLILPLESFGEGIDFLLSNPALAQQLGAAGQEHWRACFTWDVIGPRYARILRGEPVDDLEAPAQALAETNAARSAYYDARVTG